MRTWTRLVLLSVMRRSFFGVTLLRAARSRRHRRDRPPSPSPSLDGRFVRGSPPSARSRRAARGSVTCDSPSISSFGIKVMRELRFIVAGRAFVRYGPSASTSGFGSSFGSSSSGVSPGSATSANSPMPTATGPSANTGRPPRLRPASMNPAAVCEIEDPERDFCRSGAPIERTSTCRSATNASSASTIPHCVCRPTTAKASGWARSGSPPNAPFRTHTNR